MIAPMAETISDPTYRFCDITVTSRGLSAAPGPTPLNMQRSSRNSRAMRTDALGRRPAGREGEEEREL